MKIALERSMSQQHISHASGSGADEGTGVKPGVPDVPSYGSDDEQISWKSNEEEDDDEVAVKDDDEDNDDDNDKTDNQEDEGQEYDEHDDEEQGDDDEQTASDNDGDDFVHPMFSTHDEEDKEEFACSSEGNKQGLLCHLASYSNNAQHSQTSGIDYLFNPNTESTSLVDVPITTFAKPPLLSATTFPPPPTPLITHLQQTPVPTPPTSFSIPDIIDAYLAKKMHGPIKTAVHLQSKRLRDEAQAENADFLNKLDDNINKIIKDQVKEQTSHPVAANLSELELKKILIDNMERNKSNHRSDEQKNLYKALVDAYESDKLILDTYGDIVSFKIHRGDKDKDEEPSAGSNRGSKKKMR
ncbi:hypothetical protein Tco_0981768 [Tanacetum coccineum]